MSASDVRAAGLLVNDSPRRSPLTRCPDDCLGEGRGIPDGEDFDGEAPDDGTPFAKATFLPFGTSNERLGGNPFDAGCDVPFGWAGRATGAVMLSGIHPFVGGGGRWIDGGGGRWALLELAADEVPGRAKDRSSSDSSESTTILLAFSFLFAFATFSGDDLPSSGAASFCFFADPGGGPRFRFLALATMTSSSSVYSVSSASSSETSVVLPLPFVPALLGETRSGDVLVLVAYLPPNCLPSHEATHSLMNAVHARLLLTSLRTTASALRNEAGPKRR